MNLDLRALKMSRHSMQIELKMYKEYTYGIIRSKSDGLRQLTFYEKSDEISRKGGMACMFVCFYCIIFIEFEIFDVTSIMMSYPKAAGRITKTTEPETENKKRFMLLYISCQLYCVKLVRL